MSKNYIFKRNNRHLLSIVVLLVFIWTLVSVVNAQESLQVKTKKNFLWSIETEKNTIYLIGSVHFLKSDSYPLPKDIENAYDCCKKIVFETDLDGMNTQASQTKMMTLGLYPEGQTLSQYVSEQTYRLLKKKALAAGLRMAQFDRFRPWLGALTLTAIELRRLGFDPNYGVDRYFFNKAKKDKKEMIFLETGEYQIDLFAKMSEREQELFLRETLKELEVVGTMTSDMMNAWKTGDVDKLYSILKISFDGYPGIYNRFFIQRNKRWISHIEDLIMQDDNVLIIVGAGHLVGKESIVELLKKKGYKIKQR